MLVVTGYKGQMMCGRFYLQESPEDIGIAFDAVVRSSWKPRYNIAPTQRVPVIRRVLELSGTPRREAIGMHWGLVPSWAKDASIGSRMINARSETASEKPSFRKAWVDRRCIVPASGFFEWKREAERKQPYLVRRNDGRPMGLAGLWECWRGPDGMELESVAVLTTAPNRFMKSIHDRMPVILESDDWTPWLDDGEDGTKIDRIDRLARPAGDGILESMPVSRHVNNPAHDDPRCLKEITVQ
jgi:putative SOS response-associated peptidase YedK